MDLKIKDHFRLDLAGSNYRLSGSELIELEQKSLDLPKSPGVHLDRSPNCFFLPRSIAPHFDTLIHTTGLDSGHHGGFISTDSGTDRQRIARLADVAGVG